MRASFGLPTHRVDVEEFVSGRAVKTLSVAAENAGFDAIFCSEHPFPPDSWMNSGGHHALDPMIVLAAVACATDSLRIHTNLFIPSYRNPYLAAKTVTSLDVISEGRLILGVGAGYLKAEFDALGARFAGRNEAFDQSLRAMKTAWTGESVVDESDGWKVVGNTQLPLPIQRPHPPIWVGGNSRRAMRRAVELGDGWSPFPVSAASAAATRTEELRTPDQLRARIGAAHEYGRSIGRSEPLEVCFVPRGLSQMREKALNADEVIESCAALADAGVTWITVALSGDSVAAQAENIAEFGERVLPYVRDLQPGLVY